MAKTLINDILKPDVWREYGVNRTAELSALWAAGIVANVPGITLPNGGGTVNMPFFNDLTGDAENLSDTTPLTVGNIAANKDVAAVIGRGRAWSVNDLAAVLSGADPFQAVIDLVATYWARQMQKELLQVLAGAMGAASMAGNVHDVSAGASEALRCFNASNFIDSVAKLGDVGGQLAAIGMHSATQAYLAKQDLITFEKSSDGKAEIPFYMGRRVIVDDGMPVTTGTYTSYLFGFGALGYAEDVIGEKDIETDRDILAADTVATMRKRFILHPRGIKWNGTPAGAFPSRAELSTVGNWERVYENKQIRIVAFKHKNA
ncbi:MAG: hypothetical protein ABS84_14895 [Rubrivivax sp. SCN 71-131]|nr:MAG: hypothetical protein ABS84_14895 [Rubrivivax sp. SCN 71-131]